ncbi:MAG: hypothetical protein GX813_04325 [Erysipelotrichia bacterium]|nr:hypothetical protein [Erysipelotrichia bacterium]
MIQQTLAKELLLKIIYDRTPFSLALKTVFRRHNLTREDRVNISAVVGCVLRHFLVMDKIIRLGYPEMEKEGIVTLLIALCNALFIKRLDQKECNDAVAPFIKEGELSAEDFINPYLEDRKLVPSDIEVGSHDFLSYRYNTPVGIVKMWHKQFGHISANKILRSNSRPGQTVVRVNNTLISNDDFFERYPEFERNKNTEGVALYRGEIKFKSHQVYEKRLACLLPLAYKEMFDVIDLDLQRGLAIYCEYPNDIFSELLAYYPTLENIDFIASNLNTLNKAKNFLARNNYLKGVNIYEAQASSIITCLSKQVQTFLVMPDNSRLNLLQLLPDYFFHFDLEKLDDYIANQKVVIEEAAAQVEEGGYLLYLIDTISKKESSAVINEFLNEHPEFVLLRDKQYFPYKKYGASYYFAALKKGGMDD